jgi:hypothetical protein
MFQETYGAGAICFFKNILSCEVEQTIRKWQLDPSGIQAFKGVFIAVWKHPHFSVATIALKLLDFERPIGRIGSLFCSLSSCNQITLV